MQHVHINLVSNQLLPNLIPALGDNACTHVILVLGDHTLKARAEALADMYRDRDIEVTLFEGRSSHDVAALKQQAREVIDRLSTEFAGMRWILNATGGTKPMSLTFTNAFNQYNIMAKAHAEPGQDPNWALIIYTDSQNKAIPILNDEDGLQLPPLPYQSVLSLDQLLEANGFMMTDAIDATNDDAVVAREALSRFLAKHYSKEKNPQMLGQLHFHASEAAKDYPNTATQILSHAPFNTWAKLYQRLADEGLIEWSEGEQEITFTSYEACRYLAGMWLEELTYLLAKGAGFEEVMMNVEGVWGDRHDRANFLTENTASKGKNNEFDVLVRHNNQLLTIECKAVNWQSKFANSQDVTQKLDNLSRKLGGVYGQSLLVSVYACPDAMRNRANDVKIALCEPVTIKAIEAALAKCQQNMR